MRIPVWSFTWEAFADLGRHWRELLRESWIFLVALVAVAAVFRSSGTGGSAGTASGQWLVATSFLFLWFRFLVLGERVSLFIGRRNPLASVWRAYLFGSLRLFGVMFLSAAVTGIVAGIVSPYLLALMLLLLPLMGRLGLVLPSGAIGNSAKLKDALALGRGHTVKLAAGTLLVTIPSLVLGAVIAIAQQAFDHLGGDLFVFVVWETLGQAVSLFTWAVWGAFMVRCHALIVDQQEAEPIPVPVTEGAA